MQINEVSMELATLLTAVAALLTSIVTVFTVSEMRKQVIKSKPKSCRSHELKLQNIDNKSNVSILEIIFF